MTQDSSGFYDTENKRRIRDNLWMPVFKTSIDSFERFTPPYRRRRRKFRYLCFPGKDCLFEKQLSEQRFIRENTIITGIEKIILLVPEIQETLIELGLDAKVYEGDFSNTIHKIEQKFPFDIANLDITGSYLSIRQRDSEFFYISTLDNFCVHQKSRYGVYRYPALNHSYCFITSNLYPGGNSSNVNSNFFNDQKNH